VEPLPIQLNGASGVPFHRQIVEQLTDLIRTGRLQPNAPLSSSRDLAGQLLVSLVTIRRAYALLEQAGLIVRGEAGDPVVTHRVEEACRERALAQACQLLSEAVAGAERLGLAPGDLDALEAERLQWEVELASGVQRRLLPASPPEIEGYDVAGLAIPCREIGGDLYDFLPCPDGSFALALADVTGKGVPAALLVSTLHASLHLLLEDGRPLPEVVARAGRQFLSSAPDNRFAGLFLARLDPSSGQLLSINAGQDPPILLRRDGEALCLTRGGSLLGIPRQTPYECERTVMRPGDLLVAFTDGITETRSPRGEEFGRERLVWHLRENRALPAAELARSVVAAAEAFSAGAAAADDRTILVARRGEVKR
jgi:sigma-B regulation protein RsbU (phosphoserine phosphatase)